MITTEDIKSLRDKTGVSVMQCKKALEDADGDADKALALLQKKGGEIANKKSDRALGSGIVSSYIHGNGSVGVLLELACETDFVAKNEEYVELAHDVAMHIAGMYPIFISNEDITDEDRLKATELFKKEVDESDKPEDIKKKMLEGKLVNYFGERVLLNQKFVKNPDLTIKQLLENATQKFGERIEVVRFKRFVVGGE